GRGAPVRAEAVLVTASAGDPTEIDVWRARPGHEPERLTPGGGIHAAVAGGDVLVTLRSSLDRPGAVATVHRGETVVTEVASRAEAPPFTPRPTMHVLGRRELRSALLLPRDRTDDGPLPVLLDPYGGPRAHRALQAPD